MTLDEVREMDVTDRFLYWIQEREAVRLNKEAGNPKPWTSDTILQSYRFCNVRRMDDSVSKWLYSNWYAPHASVSKGDKAWLRVFLSCVIARHFNHPDTLGLIGSPMDSKKSIDVYLDEARQKLYDYRSKGGRVFNPAYIISGGTGKGIVKDKIDIVFDCILFPLLETPPDIDTTSIQHTIEILQTYDGLGSFMAGQITADLRWALYGSWQDKDTWAAKGPGSTRGMCRILGRPPKKSGINQASFTKCLTSLMNTCKQELPESITKRLEAIDYQNCLCEFDKYERVLHGQGEPKQKYPGKR